MGRSAVVHLTGPRTERRHSFQYAGKLRTSQAVWIQIAIILRETLEAHLRES
jgi:hypothetical protein